MGEHKQYDPALACSLLIRRQALLTSSRSVLTILPSSESLAIWEPLAGQYTDW